MNSRFHLAHNETNCGALNGIKLVRLITQQKLIHASFPCLQVSFVFISPRHDLQHFKAFEQSHFVRRRMQSDEGSGTVTNVEQHETEAHRRNQTRWPGSR